MVTVIADKGELTTPVHNGVPAGSNDMERPYQYIKDYQEVDFYRSPSCKPLPEDFQESHDHAQTKSSIKGTFFVQIAAMEPATPLQTNQPSGDPTNDGSALLLTLTDGIITVRGLTTDRIPELSLRTRSGCKLLLTGVIPIENGLLQLTQANTQFQYGSSTYPRPRSAYRGRGGGSFRPSYEGRRGGSGNTRYDDDANESHFLKRPPPKSTLMDFIKPLKPSDDAKPPAESETNQKPKDRYENKRRTAEQYSKGNNGVNVAHVNPYYVPHLNFVEQPPFQPDGFDEPLESEDDPSQANYRERRNPLPPRLQRAQEERTRRTTNRFYDETTFLPGAELNGGYRNGAASHPSLSSSASFSRRADSSVYMAGNSSNAQQHATTLNYVPHANMLAAVNASGQPHIAYFQTTSGPLTYGLPAASFHGQSTATAPSYAGNEHLAYYYGAAFATPAYLPPVVTNGSSQEYQAYNDQSGAPTKSAAEENEAKTSDEPLTTDNPKNNSTATATTDPENKSQPAATEQKGVASSAASSSNDGNPASQRAAAPSEQTGEKRRDTHTNPRPRWRVGDMCLARWSEDREFYVASVIRIQPPCCTVMFRDYNSYAQVHFGDMKLLPRDQQYFQMVPPLIAPSSDLNPLAASAYFPTRTAYYPTAIDGCIMMPEAPPFPFNSAGTLYMYPQTLPAVLSRSPRYQADDFASFQQPDQRNEHEHDAPPVPSKESNDTGVIDSTATSVDDTQPPQSDATAGLDSEVRLCSIADAPLALVTTDADRARSTSTESLTSSQHEEQQSVTEEEKPDNDTDAKNTST